MTRPAADWASGERMLGQAVAYSLENVEAITPDLLTRPTPCRGWDLRMLIWHSCESLAALGEGLAAGWISLAAGPVTVAADPVRAVAGLVGPARADDGCRVADPVAAYTVRTLRLLDCLASPARPDVWIGGLALPRRVVAAAGALEVAVHGWDVAEACGTRQPVPAALAGELLAVAALLVPGAGRGPLFGAPVSVSREAVASDRLAAFLGRTTAPAGAHRRR
jgi:uncharacterized protein (TIGR03083 family)